MKSRYCVLFGVFVMKLGGFGPSDDVFSKPITVVGCDIFLSKSCMRVSVDVLMASLDLIVKHGGGSDSYSANADMIVVRQPGVLRGSDVRVLCSRCNLLSARCSTLR